MENEKVEDAEIVEEPTEKQAPPKQEVPPEVLARHKAAECAGKINEILKEYSFMLSVTHEIITTKNKDGRTVLDIDHQIRFVDKPAN